MRGDRGERERRERRRQEGWTSSAAWRLLSEGCPITSDVRGVTEGEKR